MDRTDPHAERVLDPTKLIFLAQPGEPLRVTLEGDRCYPRVRVVAAFPLTDPDSYISLLDGKEEEIGVVPGLSHFSPEQRRMVKAELAKRYYMPVISRVAKVREEFGLSYWDVETDRGPKTFVLRGMQEHVTEIGPNRLMIMDVEGNRFELRDWENMDDKTYGHLVRLL